MAKGLRSKSKVAARRIKRQDPASIYKITAEQRIQQASARLAALAKQPKISSSSLTSSSSDDADADADADADGAAAAETRQQLRTSFGSMPDEGVSFGAADATSTRLAADAVAFKPTRRTRLGMADFAMLGLVDPDVLGHVAAEGEGASGAAVEGAGSRQSLGWLFGCSDDELSS
ncbi:hypothetical protein OC842_001943 [Tilletia horrida]|uniref:DUF2423 domain-containing protein n=1 Tax=Tilletia horrida TaxID=155126 RepID=A0AAN6GEP6_9BASI|nr:hypothetical protein OC842_001943 [Tilletia horrida]